MYEKKAPASDTNGVIVTNPTANAINSRPAIKKPSGAPGPGPLAMASSPSPPMTVNGAAAAITIRTMPITPS
ncbi:Uncharacterised protein [Mycobacteroides abscessus subsp. abscessus]|nr:Uncharacterised protein [Mycobacteroides abscessus subsp. abscessus]